jgi:hypothetical protein
MLDHVARVTAEVGLVEPAARALISLARRRIASTSGVPPVSRPNARDSSSARSAIRCRSRVSGPGRRSNHFLALAAEARDGLAERCVSTAAAPSSSSILRERSRLRVGLERTVMAADRAGDLLGKAPARDHLAADGMVRLERALLDRGEAPVVALRRGRWRWR